jgi:hypothetical protein
MAIVACFAFTDSVAARDRCPNGYDFERQSQTCVPNRPGRGGYRREGGNRCPDGYDWTRDGCVPNRPYRRGRDRCPNGYDWTRDGCVPNRR